MRGKNWSMVMFHENEKCQFSFYWIKIYVAINGLNYEFLTESEKDILDILDEFHIMSSRDNV